MISNDIGRAPKRIGVKMRVPRGRRRLRMAQELPNDRKAEARARANRREGVPKIMDAHAFEARVPLYRPPRLFQAGPRPAHVGSGYDKGAAALAIPQEVRRRRRFITIDFRPVLLSGRLISPRSKSMWLHSRVRISCSLAPVNIEETEG